MPTFVTASKYAGGTLRSMIMEREWRKRNRRDDPVRRVIDTRQTKKIGRCIYCGTTEGRLSDEHVTPYGLSGRLVLVDASCDRHEKVNSVWQDHWKVIRLPIFPLPASIDGRPYAGGIECISMDIFELGERGEEIAKRHHADKVIPPKFSAEDFARFVGKMAYGYAVER